MWVCRAGQNGEYYQLLFDSKKLFLPWENFQVDLKNIVLMNDIKKIVSNEKGTENKTSISNWAGQLFAFVHNMKIGDLVMVPNKYSQNFTLVRINGEYEYYPSGFGELHHARSVDILIKNIPKEVFQQNVLYSMRAYRTLFKAKNETIILEQIKQWKEK